MKETEKQFLEAVEEAKRRLAAGEKPKDVFDEYYMDPRDEFMMMVVLLNDKWNYVDRNGGILSDTWFDYCDEFHEGLARVLLNGKWNYINRNGDILSATWFEKCWDFREGLAAVAMNDKGWNFIDHKCNYISDKWFDSCGDFHEGFATVELNDRFNYIDTKGEYLSYIWFDWCGHFDDGLAQVGLNGIDYLLRKDGALRKYGIEPVKEEDENTAGKAAGKVRGKAAGEEAKRRLAAGEKPEEVFDDCCDFHEGFAVVGLDDKYNYIDHDGNYLSDKWFDSCGIFHDGFAAVKLNGKWNYINHEGNYLSDTWFDICGNFRKGFVWVRMNGMNYRLRNDGILCDYDTKEPIEPGQLVSLNKAAQEYSFMIPTQCESDSQWKRETEQHFKDGAIWGKEQAIKKACECLWNIFQDDSCGIPMFDEGIKELIEDFKKAMEE